MPSRFFVITTAAISLAGAAGSMTVATQSSYANDRKSPAFSDGSFETPQISQQIKTFRSTESDNNTIGPWKVTVKTVDLVRGWQTADGSQILDLNGTNATDLNITQPGAVEQTFATKKGEMYKLTFSLAGNPQRGPAVKTGEVKINGQKVQDFSVDVTGKTVNDLGWKQQQVTFIAADKSTTLTFASTTGDPSNPSPSGPLIDNVKVETFRLHK
ncbi:choice-of-anchor C family protein [Kitasatospora sp. NPDC048540]|uniref:choice-of-anchor C family protein n=1 Tax=unclassified Kitasatospora TaxID=2633591 RepID=UPI00053B1057|nr:choice-of-anchor C family protein [Kitasatospora sp. MBT63]